MKINRNHCYYCGIQTDPQNYEEIGNNTIWVCNEPQCQKELREEIASFVADERAQAEDERKNGWMSW